MDLGGILDVTPTEYRNFVHEIPLIPGNVIQVHFHATTAIPAAQELARWRFDAGLPVLLTVLPMTHPLVCTSHTSHWATPSNWRVIQFQCTVRPTLVTLHIQYVGPGGVRPAIHMRPGHVLPTLDDEVITPVTTQVADLLSRMEGSHADDLPPAESKPINPTRLAKFDKEFGASRFEMKSPSGFKTTIDSVTFSRRYLPSVTIGDCRDGLEHDLRSPGHPLWTFKKLG
jgi:hypothetical protein